MPVYEYRCDACGEVFDLFVRSSKQQPVPVCPKCESDKVRKNISLFGVGGASSVNRGGGVSAASCGAGPV
jgi:putative FmdB family regulatory protein